MIIGWYCNNKHGKRLLQIEKVAKVCNCCPETVKEWFIRDLHTSGDKDNYVDAGKVVSFLVNNDMPVSAELFPPCTRKILIISSDTHSLQYEERVHCTLNCLAEKYNLLIEITKPGKPSDLAILANSPDIIIYFLTNFDRHDQNTISLIGSFPELKTIFFLEDLYLFPPDIRQIMRQMTLVIEPTVTGHRICSLLRKKISDA